jgi:hypothetical protein
MLENGYWKIDIGKWILESSFFILICPDILCSLFFTNCISRKVR